MDFEQIYRSPNSIIVKKFVDNHLIAFFMDIISVITKDIEGWQQEYIFKNDEKYYEKNINKSWAILSEKYYNECHVDRIADLERLDLAALTKLLQFRLLNNKDYEKKFIQKIIYSDVRAELFIQLCIYVRNDFRNDSAHSSRYTLNNLNNKDEVLYKKLKKLSVKIEKASYELKKYLVRGAEVKAVFDKFLDIRLKPLLEKYNMAKSGEDIDYEKDIDREIDFKELATYNIIVDHTIFLDKNGYEAIRMLVDEGKEIFAEQTVLEKLKEEQSRSRTDELYDDIKKIIINLERWANKKDHTPKLILLENANVIEQLTKVGEDIRCCVLTYDSSFANKVWNICKPNVIVLRPKTGKMFEVYKKNSENRKFAVEIVSGLGEVKLEEKNNKYDNEYERKDNIKSDNDINKERYRFDNDNIPEKGVLVYVGEPKKGRSYTLWNLVSEGGEGCIYEYKEDTTSYAKIYKKGQLTTLKARKIEEMVARKEEFSDDVCWPQEILYNSSYKDDKVIVGYSMKKAGYKKDKGVIGTVRQVILSIVKGEYQWKREDLVRICYKCSLLFEKLHKKNIWMGDVNPDNIIVDEDREVYFIDTDSYQFSDFNCPVGTVEFTSPELLKKMDTENLGYADIIRNPEDEQFAIAVLYFYILFLSDFPYNINVNTNAKECILKHRFRFSGGKDNKRNYIWPNLTEKIKSMFKGNFAEGIRFSDEKWSEALNDMLNMKETVRKCLVAEENEVDRLLENDSENTYERELSNEIFPDSAVENELQTWQNIKCKWCQKPYRKARVKDAPLEKNELECPRCKEVKKLLQKRIYKLVCPKCNELWTINRWDIAGCNSEQMCCPDCDENFIYSRKGELEENQSKSETFKQDIENQMSFALKMYRKGLS